MKCIHGMEVSSTNGCAACAMALRCRHCKGPLVDFRLADGCPCNSPRGINHGLVPKACCTCKECDPAQTGCSRVRDPAPPPNGPKEVHEGVAQLLKPPTDGIATAPHWDWVIEVSPDTFFALGAIAEVERWKGKKIRVTIEEIP